MLTPGHPAHWVKSSTFHSRTRRKNNGCSWVGTSQASQMIQTNSVLKMFCKGTTGLLIQVIHQKPSNGKSLQELRNVMTHCISTLVTHLLACNLLCTTTAVCCLAWLPNNSTHLVRHRLLALHMSQLGSKQHLQQATINQSFILCLFTLRWY